MSMPAWVMLIGRAHPAVVIPACTHARAVEIAGEYAQSVGANVTLTRVGSSTHTLVRPYLCAGPREPGGMTPLDSPLRRAG